ncbi:lysylphosphatidylglycerol biosynthesis bifunctional LysX domain protein [Mycobacterium xenopi 4042]|uniref:Lysylphosphatidylglycerol biosynthesis bifunctional LysX domain protein n=1 Tax=Mycobacterium xenopi 4042 TaxID=1299334 RepID=X8DDM0_MYCXE|nr:lysylphosphatidylglycerol biosynthesis bifunctional LysX domain protein [Mycobacterium xenopi 4042]
MFGALALIAAAIVLFQSQRAENALTGEDESAIRGCSSCTDTTTPWATSRPAATSRWCSPPTDAPPSPTGWRSASASPAAIPSGP